MSKKNLEDDLKRCRTMISADWKMQNNWADRNTNFIYNAQTLEECLEKIASLGADKDYALHRWYNYMTSIAVENLFCEFGAIHEKDLYNHDVDIYIDDIPFDVKLTVYPAKLYDRPYNLSTRTGKNEMIKWYYANQSQQSRKQLLNRLYVVCDDKNNEERLTMKSDFDLLRSKIKSFMTYIREHGLNKVTINDNGKDYELYSDIIYIHYN